MTPAIADSRYITDSKLCPEGVRYNESWLYIYVVVQNCFRLKIFKPVWFLFSIVYMYM